MAKEEAHKWGRYILLAIAIVFACGGWAVTVRRNATDIVILQTDVKEVEGDVHKLELADKDISNIAQNTLKTLTQVNASLESIKNLQIKQATIQAVNSEKLKTLTKD